MVHTVFNGLSLSREWADHSNFLEGSIEHVETKLLVSKSLKSGQPTKSYSRNSGPSCEVVKRVSYAKTTESATVTLHLVFFGLKISESKKMEKWP